MRKVLLCALSIAICISQGCTGKYTQNANNIKKVQIGMDKKQVINIMGVPEFIDADTFDKERYSYIYGAPMLYSDNFYIFFSRKDSVVVAIGYAQ